MSEQADYPRAGELLERLRSELAEVEHAIRTHRFLDELEAGDVPEEALRAFCGEQRAIVSSDRRSFAQLAARFPGPPGGDLFLALATGEGEALSHLELLGRWLGVDAAWIASYEHHPGCQAYPAFVAWLALNGSVADVTCAFLANLAAWGENCGRVAQALPQRYGAPKEAVGFLRFFADPPPESRDQQLGVLEWALAHGDDPDRARRSARLLQAYELSYWDALAELGQESAQ